MRKVVTILFIFFSITASGQANLGETEYAIRQAHPYNKWTTGYTDDGTKYIASDMGYGNFAYYFDKETGLSDFNIQIPFSILTITIFMPC